MTAPQLTLATVAVIRPAMSEAMNVATLEPLELSIHPRARPPSRRAPPPDAPSVPPYDRPGEPATLLPGRKAPPTRSHAPPAATATVDRPPATHAASDKSAAPANTRPSRSTSANPLSRVPRIHVHLATARLVEREVDLATETLQQPHSRPPSPRKQRVIYARDEQRDPRPRHGALVDESGAMRLSRGARLAAIACIDWR